MAAVRIRIVAAIALAALAAYGAAIAAHALRGGATEASRALTGTTAQRAPIALGLRGGDVRHVVVTRFMVGCARGLEMDVVAKPSSVGDIRATGAGGRFVFAQSERGVYPNGETAWTGRLSAHGALHAGDAASGEVSFTERLYQEGTPVDSCASGPVAFSVR